MTLNDEHAILTELRKISAYAEMQRKITKWSLILVPVFLVGMGVFSVTMEHRLKAKVEGTDSLKKMDWYDVSHKVRECRLDDAIRIADAHRRLDEAVFAAYNWPADLPDASLLERLLAMNQAQGKKTT